MFIRQAGMFFFYFFSPLITVIVKIFAGKKPPNPEQLRKQVDISAAEIRDY